MAKPRPQMFVNDIITTHSTTLFVINCFHHSSLLHNNREDHETRATFCYCNLFVVGIH